MSLHSEVVARATTRGKEAGSSMGASTVYQHLGYDGIMKLPTFTAVLSSPT